MAKEPSFLLFRDKLMVYSRMGLFIVLVSFGQSPCFSTTHSVKANVKTHLNCTQVLESEICPPNWIKIEDPPLCLYHSYDFRSFSESKAYCHSLGSNVDIVVTFNQDMGIVVMESIIENGYKNPWLSYNDWDGDHKWEWSDSIFVLSNYMYSNFDTQDLKARNRRYRCVIVSTRTQKWVSMNCTHLNSVVCQKQSQNGTCEQNWTKLTQRYCIKPLHEKNAFINSRNSCNNENSHLLYISNRGYGTALNVYFNTLRTTWIGIQSIKTDNEYVWKLSTGEELSPGHSLWIHPQRSIAKNKHCAILSNGSAWDSKSCDVKLPVTCMRQWAGGPTNTSMELNFHRPDNVFYAGVPMLATCTFIGDDPTKMGWTVVNESGVFNIEKSAFDISTDILPSDEGVCQSQVTSTLVVNDWGITQFATLSCFAAKLVRHPNCSFAYKSLRLCDAKIFSVIAGPTRRPDLRLEYDGKSNVYEVESGSSITAKCTVHTGKGGTLQWMLSFKTEATVLKKDDERIVSYTRNEIKHEIHSELRIRLEVSQSGTTISCFGYDAAKFNSGTSCRQDDRFCSKSNKIKVYKYDSGYQFLSYQTLAFFLGLTAILTLTILAAKMLSTQLGEGESRLDTGAHTVPVSQLSVQDVSGTHELRYSGERGSVSTSVDAKIERGSVSTSVDARI